MKYFKFQPYEIKKSLAYVKLTYAKYAHILRLEFQ